MKLNKLNLAAFALCAFMFASCGDKNKDNGNDNLSGNEIAVADPKTPADHKLNLEKSGETLATEMKDMQSVPAMEVMTSLASLINQPAMEQALVATPYKMSQLAKNNGTINQMFSALESIPGTDVKLEWDKVVGTYTFDKVTHSLVKTASAELVYIFPGTPGGTVNNAKLVVTKPTWYTGKFVYNTQTATTLVPTAITATLSLDNKTIMTYAFNLTIDATAGTITKLTSSLGVGAYSFSYTVENKESKAISEKYTFAHNTTTLIEMYAGITGDWSGVSVIKNQDAPQNMVTTAESYVQIMNIKMKGIADVKNMLAEMNATPEKDQTDAKAAEILNKYLKFTVNYASNDRLIASVLFTPSATKSQDLRDNMTFVFADGSKVDPRVYFNTGWENLMKKFEEMLPASITGGNDSAK